MGHVLLILGSIRQQHGLNFSLLLRMIITDFAVNDQVLHEADVNNTVFDLFAELIQLPNRPAILALEKFSTAGIWKKDAQCGNDSDIGTATGILWNGKNNDGVFGATGGTTRKTTGPVRCSITIFCGASIFSLQLPVLVHR
jgi:hypothetical protein